MGLRPPPSSCSPGWSGGAWSPWRSRTRGSRTPSATSSTSRTWSGRACPPTPRRGSARSDAGGARSIDRRAVTVSPVGRLKISRRCAGVFRAHRHGCAVRRGSRRDAGRRFPARLYARYGDAYCPLWERSQSPVRTPRRTQHMRLSLSGAKRSLASRIAIAAAGLALGSTMAVATATTANAAIACKVTYEQNQWPGGMSVNLTIQNLGDALNGWTLTFTFPDSGQRVDYGLSANWSQQGQSVTATSLDWNRSVPSGGSVNIGFNGSWSGSNPTPTDFKINGVACNGTPSSPPVTPPVTPPVSPSPSIQPPPSPTVAATVSQQRGGCVDNPSEGADGYVNPEWRAKALSEPGGSRVANTATSVWLDRIAAIEGAGKMGLRAHLNEA